MVTVADAVRITVVVDNWIDMLLAEAPDVERTGLVEHFDPSRRPVQAEFGISFLVEVRTAQRWQRIMFDAGLSPTVLLNNCRALGIDVTQIDQVAISHGHPDHYGGVYGLLRAIGRRVSVVTHSDAFLPRYALMPDGRTSANYNASLRYDELEKAGASVVLATEAVELATGTITSGEIPRRSAFEGPREPSAFHAPGLYQVKDGRFGLDEVMDEIVLIINVKRAGLVVLTGCGHAGVINSLSTAEALTGVQQVAFVAGGFHLGFPTTPAENVAKTVEALRDLDPAMVMPMHCSGVAAVAALRSELRDAFLHPAVGTSVRIGEW
ncbi:MAG: MBL fold metallo-hydrolase [Chloroflexi bacterium]|nr:MBL fold metallo-hydrolase [Chloroflexota bacterium]